jgi:hypothetical protein
LARKKNKPTNFFVLISAVAIVLGGLAVAALIHHPSDAEAGQSQMKDRSRIFMLQDTIQPRPGLTYVYHGKKYYLSCGGCLTAFQQNAVIQPRSRSGRREISGPGGCACLRAYQGRAYFLVPLRI